MSKFAAHGPHLLRPIHPPHRRFEKVSSCGPNIGNIPKEHTQYGQDPSIEKFIAGFSWEGLRDIRSDERFSAMRDGPDPNDNTLTQQSVEKLESTAHVVPLTPTAAFAASAPAWRNV